MNETPIITRTKHYYIVDDIVEYELFYLDPIYQRLEKSLFSAPTTGKPSMYLRVYHDNVGYPKRIIEYCQKDKELRVTDFTYNEKGELLKFEDNEGNWWDKHVMSEPIDKHHVWPLKRLLTEYKFIIDAISRYDLKMNHTSKEFDNVLAQNNRILKLTLSWGT